MKKFKEWHSAHDMASWYIETKELKLRLNKTFRELNINVDQFIVLATLIDNQELTPTLLCKKCNESASGVSRKLNSLQKNGFIEKDRIVVNDQRKVKLTVTDLGIATYTQISMLFD